jgi:hypothetical protein
MIEEEECILYPGEECTGCLECEEYDEDDVCQGCEEDTCIGCEL